MLYKYIHVHVRLYIHYVACAVARTHTHTNTHIYATLLQNGHTHKEYKEYRINFLWQKIPPHHK